MNGKKSDPEEVREMLEVIGDKIPGLLNDLSESLPKLLGGIRDSIYSEEAGRNMAKSIAAYYSELKDSELPEEMILKMTKDYAENLNISKIIGGIQKPLVARYGKDENED